MKPMISVIMPAYNASLFVGEAIQSILNQTEFNFELLICDDGSSDNTLSVIQSFKDKRIKIFENRKNKGNLKTTNFLFSKCSGDYITIQDADDFSSPKRFELLLNEFLLDSTLGVIGSNYEVVKEDKSPISCGFLPLTDSGIKALMEKEVIPMLYGSIMFKKEILNKIGHFRSFFNRRGYADLDWLARCAEITTVKNTKSILYYYRKHENSFTTKSKDISFIWQNIHYLIIYAHKIRVSGSIDYFESNNQNSMKFQLSEFYISKSEGFYWEGNAKKAYTMLFKAFLCCSFNKRIYKTASFIMRNNK